MVDLGARWRDVGGQAAEVVSAHSSRRCPTRRTACRQLRGAASLLFLFKESGQDQQVVGEYGGAHEGLESLASAA